MWRALSVVSLVTLVVAACAGPEVSKPRGPRVASPSAMVVAAPASRWTKSAAPVHRGPAGFAADPAVVRDGSGLRLFYTCVDPDRSVAAICAATSTDGLTWRDVATGEGNAIVLRGEPGTWADTLETAAVVRRGREYLLFYSGYRDRDPGALRPASLGLARSTDGVRFTRRRAPVLQPTSGGYDGDAMFSPTVVPTAGGFAMIYVGHCYKKCAHGAGAFLLGATSPDGVAWTKRPQPVMGASEVRTWTRYGVAEPDLVLGRDGDYYLFVTGNFGDDEARLISVARSRSPFGPWRLARDPIVTGTPGLFDRTGVLAPTIVLDEARVRMWYLTYPGEAQANIGYAEASWPLDGFE
jgi:predicted GH43/DUF377 family glycosyl hydrolase